MKRVIVLENIRSAYNVGNIIRTADALGWDVWLCGYTPNPLNSQKVKKTSLGSENNVMIKQFDYTQDVLNYAKKNDFEIIAAEVSKGAIDLKEFSKNIKSNQNLAVLFGNEIDGVLKETLKNVNNIVYVPMHGVKESLNVGQTTAIFMRELKN